MIRYERNTVLENIGSMYWPEHTEHMRFTVKHKQLKATKRKVILSVPAAGHPIKNI